MRATQAMDEGLLATALHCSFVLDVTVPFYLWVCGMHPTHAAQADCFFVLCCVSCTVNWALSPAAGIA